MGDGNTLFRKVERSSVTAVTRVTHDKGCPVWYVIRLRSTMYQVLSGSLSSSLSLRLKLYSGSLSFKAHPDCHS